MEKNISNSLNLENIKVIDIYAYSENKILGKGSYGTVYFLSFYKRVKI